MNLIQNNYKIIFIKPAKYVYRCLANFLPEMWAFLEVRTVSFTSLTQPIPLSRPNTQIKVYTH